MCNIMYDGVLLIKLPKWAILVSFAGDITAVLRARNDDELQWRVRHVVWLVRNWLHAHGLDLTANKTKVVVLTRQRCFYISLEVNFAGVNITAKEAVKYLGEIIDRKLIHWTHIKGAAEKASKMAASLVTRMPNLCGSKSSKKRILMSLVQMSILSCYTGRRCGRTL